MPRKYIIPLLLTAGSSAIVYGMLRENNFVFLAGIVVAIAGYCLIRKRIKSRKHNIDPPDIPASSEEE